MQKINIYQVLVRLFGNKIRDGRPWGYPAENGIGKFNDFTDKALSEIKKLGISHIWYTGILHHALINDYKTIGVSDDDPDVVKGRAGSPYAVKDYYNVNPDLAEDPSKRMDEFVELIKRTHKQGMKVVMDIIPNHVARKYQSISKPSGIKDFGEEDDTEMEYKRDNNFYYIPEQPFQVPDFPDTYKPLGGEPHPLSDGQFYEFPAKWTGNGARKAKPAFTDWYETVKLNFGIRPDGSKDFQELPPGFDIKSSEEHYNFWKKQNVPDTWKKFRDIALFWLEKGVDGFRYDMAEMVPVEFWSYLNSAIKTFYTDTILIAEIYNPELYRDFIRIGKMDYLYDKVGLYDCLKNITKRYEGTDRIIEVQNSVADIEHHMLHFLENHDEHRIASTEFAGYPEKAKPAMVISACTGSSPTMIYFGQECGEPADDNPGFGAAGHTTIFDYWHVPKHQKWMNGGSFDGGSLSDEEKNLRAFYRNLLNLKLKNYALSGKYREIHSFNRYYTEWYNDQIFSFVRWHEDEKLIIIVNFNEESTYGFELGLPVEMIREWKLEKGNYSMTDLLSGKIGFILKVEEITAKVRVDIEALGSLVLRLESIK